MSKTSKPWFLLAFYTFTDSVKLFWYWNCVEAAYSVYIKHYNFTSGCYINIVSQIFRCICRFQPFTVRHDSVWQHLVDALLTGTWRGESCQLLINCLLARSEGIKIQHAGFDFNARYIFLDNIAYVRILKYGEQTCGKILRKSF